MGFFLDVIGARRPVAASLAALAALTAPAEAPSQRHHPSGAQRIVRVFDFEERHIHSEPVPMHWIRAQDAPPERPRPEYPQWNQAAFDFSVSASGDASVKLPTQGGSTSLRLVSGAIPVIPGGEYVVTAKVRTDGLRHAGARLVARLTDSGTEPLADTVRATDVIRTDGAWRDIEVRLPVDEPSAAWLEIDLELLQPGALAWETSSIIDRLDPAIEDVSGAAWFDDVVVRIAPRVELETAHPSGVIISPETPVIHARVDDVVGDRLVAALTLRDIDGEVVSTRRIDPVRAGASVEWKPSPPSYGWWRVELDVFAHGEPIASSQRDFVWTPRNSAQRSDHDRFELALDPLPPDAEPILLALIDAIGSGAVSVPYWRAGHTKPAIDAELPRLTRLLEAFLTRRQLVTFVLERVPEDLARELHVETHHVIEALSGDRASWAPWLDDALTRFGQRVRRWRIGSLTDNAARHSAPTAELLAAAADQIGESVLNPIPSIPWTATLAAPDIPSDHIGLSISMPETLPPASLLDYAAVWPDVPELTVGFENAAPSALNQRAEAERLAQRAVHAWAVGIDRISIDQPWSWSEGDDGRRRADPDATLGVWSRLAAHLSDRHVVGELPVAPGAQAFVLDGPAGGAIVAWNEHAQPDDARISAYLADGSVIAYDIFGNESVIETIESRHVIPLTTSPVFIEGVDAALARFRAGFRIDPNEIESTAAIHPLEIIVSNPWPVTISGAIRIIEPVSWNISPRALSFTIAPGEDVRLPIEASFGLSEEAGRHTIRAEARINALDRYPLIHIDTRIDVGLTGVELVPSYQLRGDTPGSRDVVVTMLVINTGDEPATLMAFASAPGMKRQQAPISDLPPRGAAIRNFVFPGAEGDLNGADVHVGLIQTHGLGRLSRRLHID